jgi:hypothetical protein
MLAHGTEHFEGTGGVRMLGDDLYVHGALRRRDRAPRRCPTRSSTARVFAGARGELSFTDVVDANPVYYPYWGNIRSAERLHGLSHKSASSRLAWPGRRQEAAAAGVTPPR